MTGLLHLLTNLFPVWVVLGGILALIHPPLFTWFGNDWITWGLAVIMLGMGITLSLDDFKGVMKMPRAVAAGFAAQYLIMPFLGWAVARGLKLPTAYAVGVILVGCCPGGTASNVVNYLARANVGQVPRLRLGRLHSETDGRPMFMHLLCLFVRLTGGINVRTGWPALTPRRGNSSRRLLRYLNAPATVSASRLFETRAPRSHERGRSSRMRQTFLAAYEPDFGRDIALRCPANQRAASSRR